MPSRIHPSAIIEDGAQIGADVAIGPFCHIGPHVTLGDRVHLHSHVVLSGRTEVGEATEIHPFAVIGGIPQDLKFKGEETQHRHRRRWRYHPHRRRRAVHGRLSRRP